MEKKCERCGSRGTPIQSGPFAGQPAPLDYCATCSKDLCDKCMAKGCCGHVPALSGMDEDDADHEEAENP